MINKQDKTAIIIVDIQEKLVKSAYNKDILTNNAQIISKVAKTLDLPLIVTEQYPKGLGETITDIKSHSPNNVTFFEKTMFNALTDINLVNKLTELNKTQIIVLGIETHICVYQTVIALLEKGYDVTVLQDACGSRAQNEHENALNIMQNAGANIKTTEMTIFELLEGAHHPKFKEIQALIK